MLRKISLAIVGATLFSGVAAAAPSSVNETMPEMTGGQSHPTMGKKDATPSKTPRKAVPHAASVSESMPMMTGGQSHPTMGKKDAALGKKPTKPVPNPSSVSESMPEMSGGQSHPTMKR